MRFGTVLLLCLAAWYGVLWVRARARAARADRLPPGVAAPPAPDDEGAHHREACVQALRAFATEYRATFQHGGCGRRAVLAMHGLRDEALRHLYAMRMRLPNDLVAEREMTRHIEETDALLLAHLADAQARCGQALVHPGPLDDRFYRQWYRAHNDVAA